MGTQAWPHGSRRDAGFLRDNNGNKIYQPIPFGPKPRLILTHLCIEAIRQKNPEIEISETFTAFVRDMGFSTSGGKRGPLTERTPSKNGALPNFNWWRAL